MTERRRTRSTEAFYGRRRGKALRPAQAAAMEEFLPALKLDLADPAPSELSSLFKSPVSSIRLEIGFGGGEHLLEAATRKPDTGFIGVEPFVNGMAKLVAALAEKPHCNIRLHDDDATVLLDWLPEGSLEQIDLLYPDPWPKQKHWKRRFVSSANLNRFARVLAPDGIFRFASDIDTYVNWTLLHCRAHPCFEWMAATSSDWNEPFPDWPGTRYEAKALRERRQPAYLTFHKLPNR